jgi:DNA-binding NtrC family response regulator
MEFQKEKNDMTTTQYSKEALARIERKLLAREIKRYRGNVARTGRKLGMSQSTLWRTLQRLELIGYAKRIRAEHELDEARKQEAKEGGDDGT